MNNTGVQDPLLPPLLLTAYMPPIPFFAYLIRSERAYLEKHDHYRKQTFRNRCHIYGANGKQSLSIPVVKVPGKQCTGDVHIDYSENWQQQHWASICSAYGKTPFFEFLKDDIQPFYEERYTSLWEYNKAIILTLLQALEIPCDLRATTSYCEDSEAGCLDTRQLIFPKGNSLHHNSSYTSPVYHQIFLKKHGFLPDLSMLDLMMNKGPESVGILLSCLPV